MEELADEFAEWKRENKLAGKDLGYQYDAEDLLLCDGTGELPRPLTAAERMWLNGFIERWDRQQALVDRLSALIGLGLGASL